MKNVNEGAFLYGITKIYFYERWLLIAASFLYEFILGNRSISFRGPCGLATRKTELKHLVTLFL